MKKFSLIAMIGLAALSFQACNNASKDSKETADSLNMAKDTSTTGMNGIAVTSDDAEFATKLANGGMTEVALGKIAQEKGTSQKVKDFGSMMVTDHSKANDELMAIAKAKNITLPATPDDEHQKMINDLSAKTGTDFDKAYVDAMVDGHEKTVSLLEDGAQNCKDADLKAFAAKILPTVKGHLEKIKEIQSSMK
ncbi:DUF4142 domain-containing protein [Mucilaginibacter segetis]|uniref:DUF4142 domain-containing protein n=1 Tax=Mucilaginibacter segetis TaxID=2793071 RepID=A0A934PWB6_9SPHI|nr:DUF4142 domain-containing protein [Mucilaginibacter segetis]MBK0380276.1 DUF4142 domain-containing protein [Mucilaginibacter segetis]